MPAYEDAANPLLCPKELEHTVLLSVPHKEAHLFLTAYCRFLSVMLDQFCTFLENLTIHIEERAREHVIFCGTTSELKQRGCGAREGYATIGEWEGRICNTLDRAFRPGTTNLSKHFEGKPPP
jgi:hypothetical protein